MPSSRFIFGTLPWYSVLIVTGVIFALILASREEKRLGLPKDTVVDLALWVIPAGVIGARAYYVAFAWDTFRANPISALFIWQGGLAIYGAVLGGLAAAFIFSRIRKIPLLRLTGMIVPGLLLAQAIGRWGNFFNMEAYGLPVTNPAWQFFPAAVLIGGTWHMATFFYESLWNTLGFLALILSRKRMHRTGDTTWWYFLLYGSGRLIIEGLRTDSLMATEALRISQLLSAALCLCAACAFLLHGLKSIGRRNLFLGGSIAAAATLAAWLLPHPAAFAGYEPAFLLTCGTAVFTAVTLRRTALIALAGTAINIAARALLVGASLPAWGISTLLAACLSLLLLLTGLGAYTAAEQRSSIAT